MTDFWDASCSPADDSVSDKKNKEQKVYRTKRCVSYNGVGLVARSGIIISVALLL
jgi:hypothetical protein